MAIFKNAALLSSLTVLALSGISCSRSSQAQTEPAKPAPPSQTSSPVPAPARPPQGFAVFAIAQPPETPPADAQPPDRILRSGHSADIDAVAFSPDARWLASGSYDKTIRIWDLSTGRSVRMLAGHTNDVWSLSFSPDGKRLVSTSQDGTARVWDANTWTALFTLTPSGMPTDAAFSLDSKFLILACQSKDEEGGGASIEIYDAAGGNKLREITMDWGRPYPLIVTPNGRILSSGGGGEDGDVNVATKIWDLTTGRELKSLPLAAEAISPDGRQIAAVASSPQGAKITLYDADTGKPLRTFDPSDSNVGHLTFSPDGTRLLAALGNGPVSGSGSTIEVWDTATGKALESLPGDKNSGLHALAISSDGKFLAAGNYAGASTRIWDLATATVVRTLEGQSFSGSLAFDLEGRLLVSESAGVRLWDVAAGEDLGVVPGVGGGQLIFSTDGNWLASNPQGALKVWNTKTWTAPNLSPPGVYMWWIGFAGPQLPPTIADSGVKAWQVADPSTLLSLLGSSNAMAVSPDRRLMAVGHQRGGDVDLWDLATSKKLVTLPAHKISVNRLAFSPDGKLLLTAGQETPITPAMISVHQLSIESAAKLWDVNTWTARSSMSYTGMGVGVGEFSRDSRFLAFTRPGLIELFEISTGKSVKRLAIDYPAGPVAFSPNGDWLASISQQGVVAWKFASSSK